MQISCKDCHGVESFKVLKTWKDWSGRPDFKAKIMNKISNNLATPSLDIAKIRADFPLLNREMNGKPIVFLDSAASSQKPQQVVEAMDYYYEQQHANVHRGVYQLSQEATDAFERARELVQAFINAASEKEIIFTRGTTEGINLVASSFGRQFLSSGDEVIVSYLEHHSNIVPWQMICEQKGAHCELFRSRSPEH